MSQVIGDMWSRVACSGMSKARLVITALFVEGQSPAEVAARYGVHRSWVYKLKTRYEAEGDAAFQPRSRRPRSSPTATPAATAELILRLRKQLTDRGLDAGADTISWHLSHTHTTHVSRATINRILTRAGVVTPQPAKRPKSSYIRFAAEQPNECWQSDFTHYRLTLPSGRPGPDVEILSWLDDCSRYLLHVSAHHLGHRPDRTHQLPRYRCCTWHPGLHADRQRDGLHHPPGRWARRPKRAGNRTPPAQRDTEKLPAEPPHHRGKVERVQQTMKKWLRAQTLQPATITDLQALLDAFQAEYNHRRPHRSLPHRATPATIYQTAPKSAPSGDRTSDTHDRVRHDKIDNGGVVTLRVNGRLHHIGIGRTHAGTPVILLIQDLHVRVVNAATGTLIRELTIDPRRDYQPTGKPFGPTNRNSRTHKT